MTENVLHNIIHRALEKVLFSYGCQNEGNKDNSKQKCNTISLDDETVRTRLVVPIYGEHGSNKGRSRLSEQELRFAFIEAFIEDENASEYLYSVETPTKERYYFGGEVPEIKNEGNYRSGNFDVVIYNKELKRVCLIEFKYGTDTSDFSKDFLKLGNPNEGENDSLRYFVHLIPKGNGGEFQNSLAMLRDKNKVRFMLVTYFPIGLSGQDLKENVINLNTIEKNNKTERT